MHGHGVHFCIRLAGSALFGYRGHLTRTPGRCDPPAATAALRHLPASPPLTHRERALHLRSTNTLALPFYTSLPSQTHDAA